MRQVPHYLIIGDGRVSRHFQHYFSLLHLSFDSWNRKESLAEFHQKLPKATHVLLLINDQAIDVFIEEYLQSVEALCVHFSGSWVSRFAQGAHPLMTFGEELYTLTQYQSIPFILDEEAPAFDILLPGLSNPHARLKAALKAKYHALCVLSGNFSCLLWQKLLDSLEQEFNFPMSIAHPYLYQQTQNLINNSKSALTGPLVRGDQQTLEKNIAALAGDPFQEVYKSFVACYQKLKEESV